MNASTTCSNGKANTNRISQHQEETMTFSIHPRLRHKLGWLAALLLAIICTGVVPLLAQQPPACDKLDVQAKFKGNCCWEFSLVNNAPTSVGFNAVNAVVLTSGAGVSSASGPALATTNHISSQITWGFPNNVPPGTTSGFTGCFYGPGVITIEFQWMAQGRVFCRDTLRLDCGVEPPTDTCKTGRLNISTGWNPYTNTLDGPGNYTTYWQVVGDPSPFTTEPRPAAIITKHPAWGGPLAGSNWISSYPNASNDTNGTYTFQTCFCVKQGAQNIRLILDLLADDRARVYVNGILVGGTTSSWAFANPPAHLDTNITQYVQPGRNCIRVEVDNTHNVAMGFDLAGYITADGIGLEKSVCCDPGSMLTGMKFKDLDCDGKKDQGEPGIPGWTIVLSNGDTAITDIFGNYYFSNLQPGTYTVSEVQQSGWYQTYPAAPGTHTVALAAGQVIGHLDFGNCDHRPGGCFEILKDTVFCRPIPGTNQVQYFYQFSLQSNMQCNGMQSASFGVAAPSGVTVSPASATLVSGPTPITLAFSGPGVSNGFVQLTVRICCIDATGAEECCDSTFAIELPPCPPPVIECCENFKKAFYRLSSSPSSNGVTTLKGFLSAGSTPIIKVSATVVSAYINGVPAPVGFQNLPSWAVPPYNHIASVQGTIPYMHEVEWNNNGYPLGTLNTPTPFGLRLKFPAMAPHAWKDEISYCVRFRYTDANCLTCDTVICFRQKRYRIIIHHPDVLTPIFPKSEKDVEGSLQGGADATLGGRLHANDSGSFHATFPEVPAELGDVRYVGFSIESADSGVTILNARSDQDLYAFSVANGVASTATFATSGSALDLALNYSDLGDRTSLEHRVVISYVVAGIDDTLQIEEYVTLNVDGGLQGGDEITADQEALSNAKTYALHLRNANGSSEPISRVALATTGDAKILAVGPTANEAVAHLGFGGDEEAEFVGQEIGTGMTIPAGEEFGPIYVTLSDVVEGTTTIRFYTINADGETISEGELVIGTTTGVGAEDGEAITGGVMLGQSYPNPTDGSTTIIVTLDDGVKNATLTVTDQTGREVARLVDGSSLEAGEHAIWFDASLLPSGTYFYTLRADGNGETRAFQVTR